MIIGNNFNPDPRKNFENANFNKKENQNQNQSMSERKQFKQPNINNNFSNNMLTKDISTFKYTNIENSNDVYDKSLAILHNRLKNNAITLEEFNKQCQALANKRNNGQ